VTSPVLALSDVTYTYPAENDPAVSGIDLTVDAGQCLSLLGPSELPRQAPFEAGHRHRPGREPVRARLPAATQRQGPRAARSWPAGVGDRFPRLLGARAAAPRGTRVHACRVVWDVADHVTSVRWSGVAIPEPTQLPIPGR
jgi:hypothetical protein